MLPHRQAVLRAAAGRRLEQWGPAGVSGQLLTAEQLADRWQVPKAHVYALSRRGAVPTVKLGKYYRYRLDAIERFELDGAGDGGHDGTIGARQVGRGDD